MIARSQEIRLKLPGSVDAAVGYSGRARNDHGESEDSRSLGTGKRSSFLALSRSVSVSQVTRKWRWRWPIEGVEALSCTVSFLNETWKVSILSPPSLARA